MSGRMHARRATKDFDPFELIPTFRMLRDTSSWRIGLGLIIFYGGICLLASARSGMLGSPRDFQPIQDFERTFGIGHPVPSKSDFPLLRDVTTWCLILFMTTTGIIVHKQWRVMARCFSGLAANGVLRPKLVLPPNPSRLAKVLRLDRYLDQDRSDKSDDLEPFLQYVNRTGAARVAKWAPGIALVTALLGLALIIGEKESLFRVLMPRGLNLAEQKAWISAAYTNWWAGENHPLGLTAYFVAALFAIYVIILQNIVGLQAVYVALALDSVADFDVDWLNRDGYYGWKPAAKVFHTVYVSLIVNGLTISLLLIALGLQSFPWISGLVAIWVVVAPLYVFVPWKIFRRIEANCRQERVEQLAQIVEHGRIDADHDLGKLRMIIVEIERVRGIRIRPLRFPEFSTLGIAVLLPIILTAAQIWFTVVP